MFKQAIMETSVGLHVGKFDAKHTNDALFRALNVGADIYQFWKRNAETGDTFVYVRSAVNSIITAARLQGPNGPEGEYIEPTFVTHLRHLQRVALATIFQIDPESPIPVFRCVLTAPDRVRSRSSERRFQ